MARLTEHIKEVIFAPSEPSFFVRSFRYIRARLPHIPFLKKFSPVFKISVVVCAVAVIVAVAFFHSGGLSAASYTWSQSSWSGGLDLGTRPVHPTNQSGWTKYDSKDASTSAATTITIASIATSTTQTTTADFHAGTFSSATTSSNSVTILGSTAGDAWSTMANTPFITSNVGGMTAANGTIYLKEYNGNGMAFASYSSSTNSWTNLAVQSTSVRGDLQSAGGDRIYAFDGFSSGTNAVKGYSISGNLWTNVGNSPSSSFYGSTAYPGSGDLIYFMENGNTSFYKYSITGNSFTALASTPTSVNNSQLVSTGNNFLYTIVGTGSWYRYSISGNSWTHMTDIPGTVTTNAAVYPGSGDYIYVVETPSSGSARLYKYSISGDSWTQMATPPIASFGNGTPLVYPGVGNYIYIVDGLSSGEGFYRYQILSTTYPTSATFTSSAIDLGQNSIPSTLNWTATTPTGTSVKFQIRTADTSGGLTSATWEGPTSGSDFYTTSGATINAINSGHRYIQYQATLATTDTTQTPTINDVTINYAFYSATTTLTSSAYDAHDSKNVLAKIAWTATTPTNTAVKFQVRTAPDSAGSPGSYTSFVGPDGTSATYFTDSTGGTAMPSVVSDGSNDEWMQYRAYLTTADGSVTPTLSSVSLTYVVNAPPDFNPDYPSTGNGGVAAFQTASGTVTTNYSVRDSDTTTGATPGFIAPSFQFSLDNGVSWTTINGTHLSSGDTDNQTVEEVSYTNHSATWHPEDYLGSVYTTTAKVRVIADDGEAANNIASSTSAAFTLDTKPPAVGATPIVIDASQSPAAITLSATDDSTFTMQVGTVSDLSGVASEAYASSKSLSISNGQTVYARFTDALGNQSSIVSTAAPATPSHMIFQDISDPATLDWRLFVAWGVVDAPTSGFKRYNIWRSTDGTNYSLLTTITDRATNYIVDTGLSTGTTYSYKVTAEDDNGSISPFSTIVSDNPDGAGGSDLTSPTVSSVSVPTVTTTGATITWTTDKLSDSTIYYTKSASYPGSDSADYTTSVGVPSMVTSHSVTLSNLDPNSQYYFLVSSTDAASNVGQSSDAGDTFTTRPGPVISNVTVPSIFDNEASITWKTSSPATSIIEYSLSPTLASSTEIAGTGSLVTDHEIDLTGLSAGTQYYYYVKSADGDGNTAVDQNIVNGVAAYYTFTTTLDGNPPAISDVSTSLVGENGVAITWDTDKPALSQVNWGTDSSLGTLTNETAIFTFQHTVVLDGLSSSADYSYEVISRDKNGNVATSSISQFTTLSPTVASSSDTSTVTTSGGGGGGILDNRDLSKPTISNLQVGQIGSDSAVVTFTTSKIANALVDYGADSSYGSVSGDPTTYKLAHRIVIVGLQPLTSYHFRARSADIYNNEGVSSDGLFSTLATGASTTADDSLDENDLTPDESAVIDQVRTGSQTFIQGILQSLAQNNNFANVSPTDFTSLVSNLASKIVGAPAISGTDIGVDVNSHSATISWTTDKPANSLIAYAEASAYQKDANDPYTITAGDPDTETTAHTVTLDNLTPSTIYHYQVRSQSSIGPSTLSTDRTFQTSSLLPQIVSPAFDSITDSGANITWQTDQPTKSSVLVTNVNTGETQTIADDDYLKDHTFSIDTLDVDTPYTAAITVVDGDGNTSDPEILPFTTVLSRQAPVLSHIQVATALIPDRTDAAQTIVSWTSDKPSTSQVLFVEGNSSDFTDSTPEDTGLVKDHTVVTTLLRPGTVYTIEVRSNDSGGNTTTSDPYTVLTPQVSASVVDLIFNNLDKTFGFLKGK